MGFLNPKDRGTAVADQAREAHDAGRTVFTAMLSYQPANPVKMFHTMTVPDWAETIEAIEAAGWRLDQWSAAALENGTVRAYPVFRRVP